MGSRPYVRRPLPPARIARLEAERISRQAEADGRPRNRSKKPWDRETQDKKKRAERLAARRPYIYFFRCRTFVKIGWTTDPAKRLNAVQVCNPDGVTLAALMRGGDREEALLHRAFQPLYHRAEWFREEGALADLIKLIADLDPVEAREVAGDWFLAAFGKLDLLNPVTPTRGTAGTKTGSRNSGCCEND